MLDKPNDALFTNPADSILSAGEHLADIRTTEEGHEFVVVPKGATIASLEFMRVHPRIQIADVELDDDESFCRYVKTFGGAATQVFANIDPEEMDCSIKAILDYHTPFGGEANRGAHRVIFKAIETVEWRHWREANRKLMGQHDFATFIEDHIPEIVDPPGARMLEIAKTMEATSKVDFKSGVKLENGDVHLKFSTETTSRAGGAADMEIPGIFYLGLQPFIAGPSYKLAARLRYRITDGHRLLFHYDLISPHIVVERCCSDIVARIATKLGVTPYMGLTSLGNNLGD